MRWLINHNYDDLNNTAHFVSVGIDINIPDFRVII